MRTRPSAASQRGWWWVPYAISAASAVIQGDKSRKAAHQANDQSIDLANSSLQRRVADARAAGIHPLAALGAGGAATPALQVGDTSWIGNLGQDINRAMGANATNEERGDRLGDFIKAKEWAQEQRDMARESHDLEMQLQRARLFRLQTDPATGPAIPSPVSPGTVPGFQLISPPAPAAATRPVGLAPKSTPGFQRYYAGDEPYDLPNSDLAEVLEGMGAAGHVVGPMMMWSHRQSRDMRERAKQYEDAYQALGPPRKGYYWKYDPAVQAWRELPKQR